MRKNRKHEQHKYSNYEQRNKRINGTKCKAINRLYKIKDRAPEKERYSKDRMNTSENFFTKREGNLTMLENTEGLEILKSEVRSVLEKMIRKKAAGPDWIVAELLCLRRFWLRQDHKSTKRNI